MILPSKKVTTPIMAIVNNIPHENNRDIRKDFFMVCFWSKLINPKIKGIDDKWHGLKMIERIPHINEAKKAKAKFRLNASVKNVNI